MVRCRPRTVSSCGFRGLDIYHVFRGITPAVDSGVAVVGHACGPPTFFVLRARRQKVEPSRPDVGDVLAS